jgi:hypothetical protein
MDRMQRRQARARERAMRTPAYRRDRRHLLLGWSIVAVGIAVGVAHMITHLGDLRYLPTEGMQDLLLGYPMAAILVLAGVLVIAMRP